MLIPFALADLDAILVAAFFLLLAASIAAIVTWLSKNTPNPSIAGIQPLNFLQTIYSDIHDWCVSTCDGSVLVIRDLVVDVFHVFKVVIDSELSATNRIASLVDHIVAVILPDTIAGIVVSYVARIFDEASRAESAEATLRAELATADSDISALRSEIGTVVHGTVEQDIAVAKAAAISASEAHSDAVAAADLQTVNDALAQVWSAVDQLQTAVTVTLPADLQNQANAENAAISQASQTAQANLVAATQQLQGELTNVQSEIDSANSAIATANANIATLSTDEAANADAISAERAVIATAQANISDLQSTAASLGSQIDANTTQISQLAATTSLQLPAIPGISGAELITVPVAVGALAAAVAGIITEVDTCSVVTCGSGPNELSNALESLLGGLITVSEFGFLAAAIKDPTGTADVLSPLLSTIDQGATDFWDAVLELV